MPGRGQVWRELRGLRSTAPGAAARNDERREVFTSALEQAQQFLEAAEMAGPATRPVQVFYGLSQLGRAIAATSTALPDSEPVLDKDGSPKMNGGKPVTVNPWRLSGHGITTVALREQARLGLAKVQVKGQERGTLPGVARALGVAALPANVPIPLGQLWPLLPETHPVPLDAAPEFPALAFDAQPTSPPVSFGWDRAELSGIPTSVYQRCREDDAELDAFLARYPSLAGYRYEPAQGITPSWGTATHGWRLSIFWPLVSNEESPEFGMSLHERKATPYRGRNDWWVFPSVAGMSEPLHPFLAWWAVLFGLSMLARYEPDSWAKMIDIDRSASANAIEHLLDQALDVVPHIAYEAIQSVSR
ncbi:YaaC family protein [Carbonactinospora thermoautotrophica]